MSEQFLGYKLARAKRYIRRAKQILKDIELMNSKVESDFFALETYCTYHETRIKGGNDEYRNNCNA
jgi:hypothetical protein